MSEKKQKKVLGRGLNALLGDSDNTDFSNYRKKNTNSLQLSLDKIHVNPNQPRTNFDSVQIDNLVISIKELGIIQPITVRKINDDKYEIISGERRYRASKMANLESIPCYVKAVEDETDLLKMSLVENVQRVDLDPIEIALTYERFINEYNLNIDDISRLVGKDRSTISNYIRLLKLDPIVQSGIRDGFLSMGHGRALINVDNKKLQIEIYERIISSKLSVRQTEKIAKGNRTSTINNSNSDVSKIYIDATNKFEKLFNSKITLKENSKGKVTLLASFNSINELYSVLKKIVN
jgi:ParB family chromosome partitioning protein